MSELVKAKKQELQAVEDEASVQGDQYLTFSLGDEVFAVGIDDIKEIIEYRDPTSVPMMPSYLRGVINLRGRVVPVIDLMVRFDREQREVSRRTCIVIIELFHDEEQQYIGVVVDAVKAVLDIADDDIEPAPSFGARLRSDFVSGMGKIGEQFVVILDIENVLSIDELAMLEDFGQASSSVDDTRRDDEAVLLEGPATEQAVESPESDEELS